MAKDYHARDIHYKPRHHDPSTVKRRICLRCDGEFTSDGPHLRLCGKCRECVDTNPSAEKTYTVSLYQ
jgi:hypothetical protein